jgi:hypothetical protein
VRCYGSTRKKRWKLLREGGGGIRNPGRHIPFPPPKFWPFWYFLI